jgi:ubiquinone/menaquinone biosynthesis C-methylase UbiE
MPLMVADNYDSELRRLNDRFCAATGIRRTDSVLDFGCGAGQTSRDAARAAVAGKVLGVDVSEQLLKRGRVGLPPVRLKSLDHSGPQRSV